jgi:hypothetical protein
MSPRRIFELDASGGWVAAIVGRRSEGDCSQYLIAWNVRTKRYVRVNHGLSCDYFVIARYLEITPPRLSWNVIGCGNFCYSRRGVVDIRKPARVRYGREEEVEGGWDNRPIYRPGPEFALHRGVVLPEDGFTLVRVRDGRRRRIAAVDAALTNAGLFYAHNRGRRPFPGRIVFIPFEQLFPE